MSKKSASSNSTFSACAPSPSSHTPKSTCGKPAPSLQTSHWKRCPSTTPSSTASTPAATPSASSNANQRECANSCAGCVPTVFEDIVALMALFRPGPLNPATPTPTFAATRRKKNHLLPTGSRKDPRRNLRRLRLPRTSHGNRPPCRRLLAGGSRPAATRNGQEKGRRNGAQRTRFIKGCADKMKKTTSRRPIRKHRSLRRLRLQQITRRAYALLSYRTAYLKARHPAAFMAAVMSAEAGSTDRLQVLVSETKRLKLTVSRRTSTKAVTTSSPKTKAPSATASVPSAASAKPSPPTSSAFAATPPTPTSSTSAAVFPKPSTPRTDSSKPSSRPAPSTHCTPTAPPSNKPSRPRYECAPPSATSSATTAAWPPPPHGNRAEILRAEKQAFGFPFSGTYYELHESALKILPLSHTKIADLRIDATVRIAGILTERRHRLPRPARTRRRRRHPHRLKRRNRSRAPPRRTQIIKKPHSRRRPSHHRRQTPAKDSAARQPSSSESHESRRLLQRPPLHPHRRLRPATRRRQLAKHAPPLQTRQPQPMRNHPALP